MSTLEILVIGIVLLGTTWFTVAMITAFAILASLIIKDLR